MKINLLLLIKVQYNCRTKASAQRAVELHKKEDQDVI